MRFTGSQAAVETEGFGETASFTIAVNGKAFKGLIDGLYSRKIEAVIRELSTNAFDAHKAAGTVAPFEVTLPTAVSPKFSIRDFGTGMSHDLMMRRYTTMFDSTKDGLNDEDDVVDADDQVGMLGLGSKSFFAYTDSCTITVWQDGEKRFYTVFMGDEGVPQIALAGRMESDEPVGVKVEFAVQRDDYKKFRLAAERVFKGFPIVPAGLPDEVRDAIAVTPSFVGGFWKLFPDQYVEKTGKVYARQGCVLYPLDLHEIDPDRIAKEERDFDYKLREWRTYTTYDLSGDYSLLGQISGTLIIDFPIGQLEFDLSRERLAYTKRTIEAARQRVKDFRADLTAVFDADFADKPDPWERMCYAYQHSAKLGEWFWQSDYGKEAKALWSNVSGSLPVGRKDYETEAFLCRKVVSVDSFFNVAFYRKNPILCDTAHGRDDSPKADIHKRAFFYADEGLPTLNRRVREYLRLNGLTIGFVLDGEHMPRRQLRALGSPKIIRESTLPAAPKVKRSSSGPKTPFDRFKLVGERGTARRVEEEEMDDTFVFLFQNHRIGIVNPDPETYPEVSLYEIEKLRKLLVLQGKTLAYVNVRASELTKLSKWDHLPKAYDFFHTLGDTVTDREVELWRQKHNWQVFNYTNYALALVYWTNLYGGEKSPILALREFSREVPDDYGRIAALSSTYFQGKHFDEVMQEKAVQAGGRVLIPNPHTNKYPWGLEQLLPTKWQRFAEFLVAVGERLGSSGRKKNKLMKQIVDNYRQLNNI